eukprot:232745_1
MNATFIDQNGEYNASTTPYWVMVFSMFTNASTTPYWVMVFIMLAFCTVVVCVVLLRRKIINCIRQSQRIQHLTEIDIISYQGNDNNKLTLMNPHNDSCAICLEDFELNEELRLLPCNHGYHMKCIDPWLHKQSELCPMCKQSIFINSNNITNNICLYSILKACCVGTRNNGDNNDNNNNNGIIILSDQEQLMLLYSETDNQQE